MVGVYFGEWVVKENLNKTYIKEMVNSEWKQTLLFLLSLFLFFFFLF